MKIFKVIALVAQLGIGTPPGGIKILLTNWRLQGTRGAAPMYAKRYIQELPEIFITFNLISVIPGGGPAISQWVFVLKAQIDVTLGYNMRGNDVTAKSDEMGEVVFHELTHAAHYKKVGNAWYDALVKAELDNILKRNNPPYGTATQGAASEIIAIGESWGAHMGHFLSDRKYGLNSSPSDNGQFVYNNGAPLAGLSSHINALEDFNPRNINDLDRWIPQGLYYDLIDVRNETAPVMDGVSGYTNQQFFNALDSDVKSIPQFRVRLLQENGNNQAAINLFGQYNY